MLARGRLDKMGGTFSELISARELAILVRPGGPLAKLHWGKAKRSVASALVAAFTQRRPWSPRSSATPESLGMAAHMSSAVVAVIAALWFHLLSDRVRTRLCRAGDAGCSRKKSGASPAQLLGPSRIGEEAGAGLRPDQPWARSVK